MSRRLSDCTSPCHSPGAVTHCQIPAACQSKDKGQAAAGGGLEAAAWQAGTRGSPTRAVLLKGTGSSRQRLLSILPNCSCRGLETANAGVNPERSPCCELSLCLGEALTHSSQHGHCCPTEQPLPHEDTGLKLGPGIPRGWQPTGGPVPVPERAGAAHRQPRYSRSHSF